MEIFKLFGSILVDSSKAEESISKTGDKAEGLGSKLSNGIATAGKWSLAIGAGIGVAAAAVGGLVMKTVDAAGALDDTAQKTGIAAEEFQKYAYAAKLCGMESNTLEKLMIKQQKAFSDASTGSATASAAYQQLGIDITNLSSGDAFNQVISKLAEMDDTTQRNALANDIFGKSYADLAPLLNEGSAGIEALKKQAVDMGAVMSNEAVASGAQFGDTLDSLQMALGGATNSIGAGFVPIMQTMADWVIEHMPEIQATIKTVFDVISIVVGTAYGWFKEYLLPVFQTLFEWVEAHMPEIQAIASAVFGVISEIVSSLWKIFGENLIPILQALWDFISPTFPLIEAVVKLTFGAVVKTVQTVVDIFDKVTESIKKAIEWLTFWKDEDAGSSGSSKSSKSESKKAKNSHAAGLPYVPYDGYQAELHKGERVLTQDQNNSLVENLINGMSTVMGQSNGGTYIINLKVGEKTLAEVLFDPLNEVAKQRGVALG